MKGIIRNGDKTTGGGTVLSGSVDMIFRGLGAERQGVPVAFHGHLGACVCALISSLPETGAS